MSARSSLAGIFGYGEKRNLSEILKIPPILKILILTNAPILPTPNNDAKIAEVQTPISLETPL